MKAAADHLASVTLELGGKSPAIIDSNANLKDSAKRVAFGKFLNNGQTCIAPDYVLVEDKIKEPFLQELKKSVAALFGQDGVVDETSPSYSRIVKCEEFSRLNTYYRTPSKKGQRLN